MPGRRSSFAIVSQDRGVSAKVLGEFRKLVWQARGAALEAKRFARAAKKAPAREKSRASCPPGVEKRKTRPDKLSALNSL